MLHQPNKKRELKSVSICSICEDKILLDNKTNTLPKCRICNETEYHKIK